MGTGRVDGFKESTMGNGMSKHNEIKRGACQRQRTCQ